MRISVRLLALSSLSLSLVAPFAGSAQAAPDGHDSAASTARVISRAVTSDAECATFDGQRYCLGLGFTDMSEQQARAARSAQRGLRTTGVRQTGDLDTAPGGPAPMTTAQRRAEFTEAAAGASKARALRTAATSAASYPAFKVILNPRRVAEQTRTYWCGPTSMQMIAWGWSGTKRSQAYWAGRLGTTTAGSSISQMVRVTNAATGWDNAAHAGKYIVLNIGGYSFRQWFTLMKKHIASYKAPVILHPILRKRYYSYLDHDGSGHFQVGRGYDTRGAYQRMTYFEPWNQQRFHSSERYIARLQYHRALYDYQANKAHSMHNIGL